MKLNVPVYFKDTIAAGWNSICIDFLGEALITKVIFNDPATIVFWSDRVKTVVKAVNEPFDPEKGLSMAICKRVFGNSGNYYRIFEKHIPEEKQIAKKCECADELVRLESENHNMRVYLDNVHKNNPEVHERLMQEFCGMPGYVPADYKLTEADMKNE